MATMKDVAKAAGVSVATVSAARSGAAYVSPKLKAQVEAAIAALGYEPNANASSLKRGRTSLIGLIVPDITNPFFTEFVHHVQRGARQAGYPVLLGVSDEDPIREADTLRLMRAHQAAGTILCPAGATVDDSALTANAGRMKVVCVYSVSPETACDAVVLDNRKAAALAVSHILDLGHRAIATIAGPQQKFAGRERLDGFVDTLAERGFAADPAYIRYGNFRQDDAYEACLDLLAMPKRPTAIFVANNHMLIGVMQAVTAAGLNVPRDISIVGIDDFPWAAAFVPTLTTIRQPIEAMARSALSYLLDRIEGGDSSPRRRVLTPELVIRHSCAAPPMSRRFA